MPPATAPNLPTGANDQSHGPSGNINSIGEVSEDEEDNVGRAPLPFVEHYPNERAGAPISAEPLDDFDLAAYIGACGPFADPKVFEAAELLVSSNLTNNERTAFLQSEVVSNEQNNYNQLLTFSHSTVQRPGAMVEQPIDDSGH